MGKTVVILGGSFGGLHVAHHLLKHTLPTEKDLKVILVSKNSHFYWNIASPRTIIPGILAHDQLFASLSDSLSRYPEANRELIIGTAEATDFTAKTVTVVLSSAASGAIPTDVERRTLNYDHLVLATGTRYATLGGAVPDPESVPWKAAGSYEDVVTALTTTRGRVAAAQTIVVAGAGATGVELAGELGFEFGKTKEITLLSSGEDIMEGDLTAKAARAELGKLNVKIQSNARVAGVTAQADGKTEVTIEGQEKMVVDLYLPTMGLVPNSDMVDDQFLNEKKYVKVDDLCRVEAAQDVWALGDVVSRPRAGFMITQKQAAGVGKNIELVIKGKEPVIVKLLPVDVFAVSTGRSRGAGRAGKIKLLSTMVWLAKGRTMGVQMLKNYANGSIA